jgi:hypothetical protein
MNTYYITTALGFLIAQFLMASISVYDYQKQKDIPYSHAMKAYLKAEIGFFVIAFFGLLTVLFVLPDIIDINIKPLDLQDKESLTWKEKAQAYFRLTVIFVGAFVQYLSFKFRKSGKQAIDKAINGVG